MIVLDTNVLSALMRSEPDRPVVRWLDGVARTSVWTTAITVQEVHFGLGLMPPSRKRSALETAFAALLDDDLEGRVLPFDRAAAAMAGRLSATESAAGRTIEVRDAQIAGIALARRASLATRNTRHFVDLGVPLVDPWSR